MIYANDRDRVQLPARTRQFGNRGLSASDDPTIRSSESGHPIRHEFTRKIPSSQCITCHVHNGNGFLNTYLGYMWWDEQTDGEHLYPKVQHDPSPEEIDRVGRFNPEQAASRGLWDDPRFLETVSELNPTLKQGAVLRLPRPRLDVPEGLQARSQGQLPRHRRQDHPVRRCDLWKKAVHLKDIHLEKGMHCVDCHFTQDVARLGQDLRRSARGDRDYLPGLPRHRVGARDARHVGAGVVQAAICRSHG